MAIVKDRDWFDTDTSLTHDSFPGLYALCKGYMNGADLEVVQRGYEMAAHAHKGVPRKSGEPYIEHPLAVARWLAERRVRADCVGAALLHDVVEDTSVAITSIQSRFGNVIATLVDGVTKFEALEEPDEEDEVSRIRERKQRQQAETLRKLLLAMAEDPRVALIKLADRLHNIRTLAATKPDRQIAKARETLDIYVPLANRLGMAEVKYELQDTALSYLDPLRYQRLQRDIAHEVAEQSEKTEATVHAIQQVLYRHKIQGATVTPHVKHLYNVYQRIQPLDMSVSDINDLITYRILVPNNSDCYAALSAIHRQWHLLDARMRDYIGTAKLNGYQALHTTVFGLDGLFDVRICTFDMQRKADDGPVLLAAAQTHIDVAQDRQQSLNWIEQVHSWQHELSLSATDFMEAVRDDLFQSQIFVFTPKGDVKDLPEQSTVLDLAYRIHTTLGTHCIGAKVTGSDGIIRSEDRDCVLKSGDIVEIIPNPKMYPDASWLRSVKTHHAHDAILHYLRTHFLPEVETAPAAEKQYEFQHARLAWCCEPGPDDELVGLLHGRSLIVHRAECRYSALSANKRYNKKAGTSTRRIPVQWDMIKPESYRVSLNITGQDRSGLMYHVAKIVADADVNLLRVRARGDNNRIKATISVTIDVRRTEQLQWIQLRLSGVIGVVSVERQHRFLCNTAE